MLEGLIAARWYVEGEKQNHFGFSCPCLDRAGEIASIPRAVLCMDSVSNISICSASGDPSLILWFV